MVIIFEKKKVKYRQRRMFLKGSPVCFTKTALVSVQGHSPRFEGKLYSLE